MEQLTLDGLVVTVDREDQTITVLDVTYDVGTTQHDEHIEAWAQVDGTDAAHAVSYDGDYWIGEIADSDMYLVLAFTIFANFGGQR